MQTIVYLLEIGVIAAKNHNKTTRVCLLPSQALSCAGSKGIISGKLLVYLTPKVYHPKDGGEFKVSAIKKTSFLFLTDLYHLIF